MIYCFIDPEEINRDFIEEHSKPRMWKEKRRNENNIY